MDYQRITVLGNTTQAAQLKKTEKGEFVILSVASKVRSGRTVYFPVFITGKMAQFYKDVTKGTPVLVDGTLDVTEYEPEGKEKRVDFRIYAEAVRRLGGEPDIVETAKKVFQPKQAVKKPTKKK